MGIKCKKIWSLIDWRVAPYAFSRQFGVKQTKEFKSKEYTFQELKHTFLGNLVSWVSLYTEESSMPLIGFIDWVDSR